MNFQIQNNEENQSPGIKQNIHRTSIKKNSGPQQRGIFI